MKLSLNSEMCNTNINKNLLYSYHIVGEVIEEALLKIASLSHANCSQCQILKRQGTSDAVLESTFHHYLHKYQ